MKKIILLFTAVLFFIYADAQQLKPVDAESKISFEIKNLGMNVTGTLRDLKGKIYFDPAALQKSYFNVTVDVKTINTGIVKRDNHLISEDYFDAAKYPHIQIKSTSITFNGNNYVANAQLTIKNVTKNVRLTFAAKQVNGGYIFGSNFALNRLQYGVGSSSLMLADNVKVILYVVAAR